MLIILSGVITNIETEEIIIANSKREAANIINGTDAGIIYAIKNNSIYKHKYKIIVYLIIIFVMVFYVILLFLK